MMFCVWNGGMQGVGLLARQDTSTLSFAIGFAMFVAGMAVNYHSDATLRALRRKGGGYQIPRGGAFEWVSGANFLAECVEWMGFAVAAGNLEGWAFAAFTASNIGPRAWRTHQWYKDTFKNKYPNNRKALIPYLL